MALSIGFIRFVSSADATQAKGLLTFAPVGLPPTEHVRFYWTHLFAKMPSGQNSFAFSNISQAINWAGSRVIET